MIRLTSCIAAALLIAAPFASADAATPKHHATAKHHAMKASTRHHARTMPHRANRGDAAVDALNEQSLNQARGGQ